MMLKSYGWNWIKKINIRNGKLIEKIDLSKKIEGLNFENIKNQDPLIIELFNKYPQIFISVKDRLNAAEKITNEKIPDDVFSPNIWDIYIKDNCAYLADRTYNRIMKCDKQGSVLKIFRNKIINEPMRIMVDKNENIHIYNENSRLIQIINKDDQLIKTVKIKPNKNGNKNAEDIEYNDTYIFLINGREIFKYDHNYNYLSSYPIQNNNRFYLKCMKDYNDNIYLKSDTFFYRFENEEFNKKFSIEIPEILFLSFLTDGNLIAYSYKKNLFCYDAVNNKTINLNKQFFISRGIAVDNENKIWLVGHDIQKINSDGNIIFKKKSQKTDRNILYISDFILNNLVLDRKNNLVIIDYRNKALLKCSTETVEELKLEPFLGQHAHPQKIKIRSNNEIYLLFSKDDANILIKF